MITLKINGRSYIARTIWEIIAQIKDYCKDMGEEYPPKRHEPTPQA